MAQRTLWVWHQMAATPLVQLAKRYKISRLLVWVSPGFTHTPTTQRWLQRLSTQARAGSLALDALCGDPAWAQRPDLAASWAGEVARSARFERLHLDIEPHALPEWNIGSADLVSGMVTAIREAVAGSDGMPVDVDVPTWYHQIPMPDGRGADEAVLDVTDSLTLMAYQDTLDKILASSGPQLANAHAAGKTASIGVNLAQPVNDAPTSSLWGQTASAQRDIIAQVAERSSAFAACDGIAIHDATSLAAL